MVDNFKLVFSDSEFYTVVESSSNKYAYRDIDYDQRELSIPLYNLKFYYNDKNFIVDKSRIRARLNKLNKTISTSEENEKITPSFETGTADSDDYVLVYIKYAIAINSDLDENVNLYLLTNYYDDKNFEVEDSTFGKYSFETKEIKSLDDEDDEDDEDDTRSIASDLSVMTESLNTDNDKYKIAIIKDGKFAFKRGINTKTKPFEIYELESYDRPGIFIVKNKNKPYATLDPITRKIKTISDADEYKIANNAGKKYAYGKDVDTTQPFDIFELESYIDKTKFIVKDKTKPYARVDPDTKKTKKYKY
jgi:hypothetical protein